VSGTVADLLDATAARRPERTVRFWSEDQSVSYAELASAARALASELVAQGVRPGDAVGVLSPNAPEFFVGLFAVAAAGGAACPLPLPFGLRDIDGYERRLARIAEVARMRTVLCSPKLGPFLDHLTAILPSVRFLTTPGTTPGTASGTTPSTTPSTASGTTLGGAAPLPSVTPDDVAILQFTSGSTAQPKGVVLTHRNVLAGLAAISNGIGLGDNDRGGFWLPLFHDMGLFGVLAGFQAAIPMHIWSPAAFIKRPDRWLREFQASGATISAMPNFGYDMLTRAVSAAEAAELDLGRWRIAFNGAEPVVAQSVADFTARFAPAGFRPEAMFPVYGMAEATLAVTFPPLGRAPAFDRVHRDALAAGRAVRLTQGTPGTLGTPGTSGAPDLPAARVVAGVGRPVAGLELRVVDPATGDPVPDDVVGEIQIRGASVTCGYLTEGAASPSGVGPDGWLRTGDLAYQRDGDVYVTGRLKEMITVRGANYYPQDVELIARTVPGVFRGNCAAVAGAAGAEAGGPEEVVLVAETALTAAAADQLAADLRRRVAAELGLAAVTVRLVKPRTIPRTSSGKVRRLATRDIPGRT
jgi:acyl-CoA synthetase (AMP-forming)/AMP-acid ligase II